MNPDEVFTQHRGLLLRLAYDITGSWSDAEDVTQQAWERWHRADVVPDQPRAYLARIATNLALDAVRRRESTGYPGVWLPEPVATGLAADEELALAGEVEIALMVVLGNLSPLERAAFLLHDVFSFSHQEVADMLGREPAAVRQLASRARRHIEQRRPVDPAAAIDARELARFTDAFIAAARQGDLDTLEQMLTADVVMVGDGGGKRPAARRPIIGPDKVARFCVGIARQVVEGTELVSVEANHRPALAFYRHGKLDTLMWFLWRDRRVTMGLSVGNPDKLALIEKQLRRREVDE